MGTESENRPRTVGVLAVHGIGEQRRGTTLRQVGAPVVDYLIRITAVRGGELRVVGQSLAQTDRPDYAEVEISHGGDSATLLIAESRWSEAFKAASFNAMLGWSVVTGVRSARTISHLAKSGLRSGSQQIAELLARLERILRRLKVPQFLISGSISFARSVPRMIARILNILGRLIVILALVLSGLLPIFLLLLVVGKFWKKTRGAVEGVRSGLSAGLGDAYTFFSKPLDRAAMVAQVRADLAWLRERTSSIIVVAHSLGAAVTIEALRDEEARGKVVQLFTVGNALSAVGLAQRRDVKSAATVSNQLVVGIDWIDLATAQDPVSMGRLVMAPPPVAPLTFDTPTVDNQHSVLRDHTDYFANTEQVTSLIAQSMLDHAEMVELADSMRQRRARASTLRTVRKNCESISTFACMFALGALVATATPNLLKRIGGWFYSLVSGALKTFPDPLERLVKPHLESPNGKLVLGIVFASALVLVANSAILVVLQRMGDRRASAVLVSQRDRLHRFPAVWSPYWAMLLGAGAIASQVALRSVVGSSTTVADFGLASAIAGTALGLFAAVSNFSTMNARDTHPHGLAHRIGRGLKILDPDAAAAGKQTDESLLRSPFRPG